MQDVLNVVASAAICLAWIEIIFMIGRYPFLGGRFSIMFYSITKRIIQGIVSFIIMVIGFGFAFFVIRKGFRKKYIYYLLYNTTFLVYSLFLLNYSYDLLATYLRVFEEKKYEKIRCESYFTSLSSFL